MHIAVVGAIHGDEPFTVRIIEALRRSRPSGISTFIAHPRAVAAGKRCLQTDLNRSFGIADSSTESRIADRLMQRLNALNPDLLIDLHASTAPIGKLGIVARNHSGLANAAGSLGMTRLLVMPRSIHRHTLIGQFPGRSVAIEFGRGLRSTALANRTAERIGRLATETSRHNLPTYQAVRPIELDEGPDGQLENYRYYPTLKGYPVLSGKGNYETHRGFLAKKA